MNEGINIVIEYQPDWRGTALWIVNKKGNDIAVVKPLMMEYETHPEGYSAPEPTLRFSGLMAQQFLQGLAEALSSIGYKPKIEDEWLGELKATKTHLEDMRAIAFKRGKP